MYQRLIHTDLTLTFTSNSHPKQNHAVVMMLVDYASPYLQNLVSH